MESYDLQSITKNRKTFNRGGKRENSRRLEPADTLPVQPVQAEPNRAGNRRGFRVKELPFTGKTDQAAHHVEPRRIFPAAKETALRLVWTHHFSFLSCFFHSFLGAGNRMPQRRKNDALKYRKIIRRCRRADCRSAIAAAGWLLLRFRRLRSRLDRNRRRSGRIPAAPAAGWPGCRRGSFCPYPD